VSLSLSLSLSPLPTDKSKKEATEQLSRFVASAVALVYINNVATLAAAVCLSGAADHSRSVLQPLSLSRSRAVAFSASLFMCLKLVPMAMNTFARELPAFSPSSPLHCFFKDYVLLCTLYPSHTHCFLFLSLSLLIHYHSPSIH
jgi:hypothetical protein